MKKFICLYGLLLCLGILHAQKDSYSVISGEFIFGLANVEREVSGDVQTIENNLRFTMFLHIGQYHHLDFSNNFGLYSGLALRNIGFITEDSALDLDKEKHRVYTIGIPLALKLGSFKDHYYCFGGAEYEFAFHYKYKWWDNGEKHKVSEWFSNRTNRFLPSVFAGVQFPKGFNIKLKYYLTNLLNPNFQKGDHPRHNYSDYKKSQMFHVSLCWQFNSNKIRRIFTEDFYETALK